MSTAFYHLFSKNIDKKSYIAEKPYSNGHIPNQKFSEKSWVSFDKPLRTHHISTHLKGNGDVGIREGLYTNYIIIDLDLHDGNTNAFRERSLRIIETFTKEIKKPDSDYTSMHVSYPTDKQSGIHLILFLKEKTVTAFAREKARRFLTSVPDFSPNDLQSFGLVPVSRIEIFPSKNGIRLPMGKNRSVLAHDFCHTIDEYNTAMYDLENSSCSYSDAVLLMQRFYNLKDDTDYAQKLSHSHTKDVTIISHSTNNQTEQTAPNHLDRWTQKDRYRENLIEFWTGERNDPDTLNKAIWLTAVLLPFYGLSEKDSIDLIWKFIDELPDHSFSTRLSKNARCKDVDGVIKRNVKRAFARLTGDLQHDTHEESQKKLFIAYQMFEHRGFDLTDKSTWTKGLNLNEQQKEEIYSILIRKRDVHLQEWRDKVDEFLIWVENRVRYRESMPMNLIAHVMKKHGLKSGMLNRVCGFTQYLLKNNIIKIFKNHSTILQRGRHYCFPGDENRRVVFKPKSKDEYKNHLFRNHVRKILGMEPINDDMSENSKEGGTIRKSNEENCNRTSNNNNSSSNQHSFLYSLDPEQNKHA